MRRVKSCNNALGRSDGNLRLRPQKACVVFVDFVPEHFGKTAGVIEVTPFANLRREISEALPLNTIGSYLVLLLYSLKKKVGINLRAHNVDKMI